jgi:hypothetical protein
MSRASRLSLADTGYQRWKPDLQGIRARSETPWIIGMVPPELQSLGARKENGAVRNGARIGSEPLFSSRQEFGNLFYFFDGDDIFILGK